MTYAEMRRRIRRASELLAGADFSYTRILVELAEVEAQLAEIEARAYHLIGDRPEQRVYFRRPHDRGL